MFACAVFIGLGIASIVRASQVMAGLGEIDHPDLDAYLGAAMRLRTGEPLYPPIPPGISQEADFLYRYAPWFAYAFVPLTFLPRAAVAVGWDAVLLVATVLVVTPALRTRSLEGLAVAAFLGGSLMEATAFSNVHALMLLPLVYRLDRSDGPLWIAAAASLKAVPIVLVLVYVGRRDWRLAGLTVALTALLVLPMLAFDLSQYPTATGTPWTSLYALSPPLWLMISVVLAVTTVRLAPTQWGWFLAAITMIVASPRIHQPYLAGLMVGGLSGRRPGVPGHGASATRA